jgi:hypothetical protein
VSPESPSRHLSLMGLEQFLEAGAPAVIRLEGTPTTLLVIDPPVGQMALRVRSDDEVLSGLDSFRLITPGIVWFEDERYVELRITGGGALVEAYPILCALADRVQIQGEEFSPAARDVLAKFRRLLQGLGRMSETEEVGLIGELMVFRRLLDHLGVKSTLDSWTGPSGEEHDFAVLDCDLEVKTTTSERRAHWIHGLTQLLPAEPRPLWLISIQLTAGGQAGGTLADHVRGIRSRLTDEDAIESFNDRLRIRGWDDDQAHLYTQRFVLRSMPQAFEILEGFPSITPSLFVAAGRVHDRISQVSYRVDLTSMQEGHNPPIPLDGFESEE